jgi:Fur family ferric uptake transcriptional regulator
MQDNILKQNGLRITENRKIVLNVLEEKHEPMTADEIFLKARKQHGLNYSTIYRILSVLTEKNIILKSVGGNGISYYQLNNHNHSHYLVCSQCHKRIPIDGCPLDELGERLVEKTGFHITGHNLEFIGECPECMGKKNLMNHQEPV